MAYFSDKLDWKILNAQCRECGDFSVFCPILTVQSNFNYGQSFQEQEFLRQALNMLIDEAGKCKMKPLIDKIKGGG